MIPKSIKARFKAKRAATRESAKSVLPVVEGPGQCRDCWSQPGETHQLSCDQVTIEQFRAVLDGAK